MKETIQTGGGLMEVFHWELVANTKKKKKLNNLLYITQKINLPALIPQLSKDEKLD